MFEIIEKFENTLADFYQAPYAVATDSCTHAIELCLRLQGIKAATCPTHTYISIPFTLTKLGIRWKFESNPWKNYYFLGNTNIIDAAVYWKQAGYIPGTQMCLSFQYKKHLNLIKGGAILLDNYSDYQQLKKMSYDGRIPGVPWRSQNIDTLGFHYYMPPETAQLGLEKFPEAVSTAAIPVDYTEYPFLPNMEIFKHVV